jgi:diguanylate cyclase (GGDEF)-like protein/PAS domain S-box-containing protein
MRIALGVTLAVLLTTALVSVAFLALVRSDMQQVVLQQQTNVLAHAANAVDEQLSFRSDVLNVLADNMPAAARGDAERMQRYLAERPALKILFDNVQVIGPGGVMLFDLKHPENNGEHDRLGIKMFNDTLAHQGGVISAPIRGEASQAPAILMTVPIRNSADAIGWVMVGAVALDHNNFLDKVTAGGTGATGYFFIVTSDLVVVTHPAADRVLQSARTLLPGDAMLRVAAGGLNGSMETALEDGVAGLVLFKRLQQTNWMVASVLPAREAFAAIDRMERRAVLLALALALLAGPLAWWVTRLQVRALDRLARRIDAVRRQPSLVAVAVTYPDNEIGRLTASFDELMRERLFAETRYQSNAEELRAATDSTLDAFFVLQAERDTTGRIKDFRVRYLNENGAHMFNVKREQVIHRCLLEVLPITHSAGYFDKYVAVLASGKALQEEVPVTIPGIRTRWLAQQITALADGVAISARDITQRKRDEGELRSNRAFLQSLVDHLPVIVYSKSLQGTSRGRFVLWNKAAERITGYSAAEVIGKTDREIFAHRVALAYEQHDRDILDRRSAIDVPTQLLRRPDREVRILHTRSLPLFDEDDKITHVLGISEDVTEQRARQRELARNQAELNAVNDASPLGLLRTDRLGHCLYANKAFEAISDLSLAQARGYGWLQAIHPEDVERVTGHWADDAARRDDQGEYRFVHRDGKLVWISIRSAPIMVGGRTTGYVGSAEDVTAQRAARDALEFSEQRLRLITDSLPALVAYIDRDERYSYCNQYYQQSLQLDPAALIGKKVREVFGYRWHQLLAVNMTAALRGVRQSFEIDADTPRGWRHFQYEYIPDVRADGDVPGFYSMVTDITQRKAMEQDLLARKEQLRVTLNSIADAVITTDMQGVVSYINAVAETMIGWSQQDAVGKPLAELFHLVHPQTGQPLPTPVALAISGGVAAGMSGSALLVTRDDRRVPVEESTAPIRDANGVMLGVVLVFHDVSAAHVMAEQMTHLAAHDALTGLLNRREFEHRLEQAVQSAQLEQRVHSVLYLDLDQFKIVNDTCGHVAGDELLRQLAVLLLDRLRSNDTLARLGGDEFGVLLEGCALEPAMRVAESLRQVVSDFHFVWEDKVFPIGVSIGLVNFGNNGATTADILRMADSACYVAKDKGRNRIHMFTEENAELVHRHGQMSWVARIRHALDNQRFVLYRQAILDLRQRESGEHYELLLRMHDEDGALIPPMAFIPAAERYGLMPLLDRWVIEQALSTHALRHPPGVDGGMCAINLSGTSICDETFLPFVLAQFERWSVAPEQICFEITETAAIANLSQAAVLIRELKAIGCKFSLDDFGSGMSSFTYLKHLPVDYLKIDGSFVKDMLDDPIDRAMVESINHIGHVMGLCTIAEFVENPQIVAALREIGVDYAQGYAIDKPHPC